MTRGLPDESRHAIRSSLTVLSLIEARAEMPDPVRVRAQVARLLAAIEAQHG